MHILYTRHLNGPHLPQHLCRRNPLTLGTLFPTDWSFSTGHYIHFVRSLILTTWSRTDKNHLVPSCIRCHIAPVRTKSICPNLFAFGPCVRHRAITNVPSKCGPEIQQHTHAAPHDINLFQRTRTFDHFHVFISPLFTHARHSPACRQRRAHTLTRTQPARVQSI